jgi:hypothetical protein
MPAHTHTTHETIDTFYVLDLDRCLIDTDRLQRAMMHVIEKDTDIDGVRLDEGRVAYEASGGSFDTAKYVTDLFKSEGRKDGRELWNSIAQAATAEAQGEDMLLPYAAELLARLKHEGRAFGILTYGGRMWQETKITASGLADIPHIVTPIKEKGILLTSWKQEDGSFLIPAPLGGGRVLRARSLVFIDDKPVSFKGIPEGVRAICAITPGATWPDDILAALSPQVEIVQGLRDVVPLLFS